MNHKLPAALLPLSILALNSAAAFAEVQVPKGSIPADITPYQRAATYDGLAKSSIYIPSYDGTRIAITIYRPTKGGQEETAPLPVVVTQARDDFRPQTVAAINYFVSRGYIWVAADRRGTGASFGVQTGFVNEADAKDGKAVIDWAGSQPFSNGKVVTYGCSNQGAWQYVVMQHKPAHLVAISPQCASAQFFDHGISMNGVPMLALGAKHYNGECARPAGGARPARNEEAPSEARQARPAAADRAAPSKPNVDADTDGSQLRQAQEGQRCGAGSMGQYWANMPRDGYNTFAKGRPALDDTAMMHTPAVKASGVAVLQIGGWSDAAVAGQFESQRVWGGKTVMGPWVHGNRSLPTVRHAGDTFDVNAEILRWFDHYARGMDNGAGKSEIVYYTQNAVPGTEWRKAANWTAASGVRQPFFLSGQALSSRAPAAGGKPVTYAQQEVKLFEGRYSPLRRMWEGNMSEADAKSLVHTGPVLAGNFQVTGTPTARLWVSTDTRDTNVFAILEDVAPDGKVSYVSDGRLRASWRKLNPTPWGPSSQLWHRGYAEDIKPMVPGQPTELAFDFFPVSYVFQKGHRIRLSIVTSIANKWQDPPMTDSKPVNLTLYQDARHPSKVELPIVR